MVYKNRSLAKNWMLILRITIAAVLGWSCLPAQAQIEKGVLVAYELKPGEAETRLRNFDTASFATQIRKAGADYVLMPLGGNSGQYIAANSKLSNICPSYNDRNPTIDIISKMIHDFQRNNLKLFLYLPFRSPQLDADMMKCLHDTAEDQPTTKEFVKDWASVIREWSSRYGKSLDGWFFDGTYNTTGIDSHEWALLCSAALEGNAARLLAYNPGEGANRAAAKPAPCQTMVAGKLNSLQPLIDGRVKFYVGIRPHILSSVTDGWGARTPLQVSCADLLKATEIMRKNGGLLTMVIAYDERLGFDDSQLALLQSAWIDRCKDHK